MWGEVPATNAARPSAHGRKTQAESAPQAAFFVGLRCANPTYALRSLWGVIIEPRSIIRASGVHLQTCSLRPSRVGWVRPTGRKPTRRATSARSEHAARISPGRLRSLLDYAALIQPTSCPWSQGVKPGLDGRRDTVERRGRIGPRAVFPVGLRFANPPTAHVRYGE